MRRSVLALISAAALLVAACSSGGTTGTPRPSTSTPADPTRIEVELTDALRIDLAMTAVPAGVPVTFVVTNTGVADHEFYLGDEAAQAHHEDEMMEMGGMGHDEPEGIAVDPGETKELTYTFEKPGMTVAGCHVAGHYAGGMKAAITVVQ
jgi:uncharacterized cupredoxin-like copper-binding protein